jgi:DNA polymerase family A
MEFSEVVPKFFGKNLYLHMSGENPDWSDDQRHPDLVVHYGSRRAILPMSDQSEVSLLASSIHHFIDPSSLIVSWRAKDIFSFLRGRTGIDSELDCRIYDLDVICSYLGFDRDRPETFKDAVSVLGNIFKDPGWDRFKKFYDLVYRPLITKVVPEMETGCLADNRRRTCVHPCYVVEGQANGRLKAIKNGSNSYNPHSLGFDDRAGLRPPDYEEVFVYFDYRNMEVNVLRWLSGDERLGAIIDSGKDPYKEIWKIVSGDNPSESQRTLCKNMFLPVVFGQGGASLAERLKVSEKTARAVIDRLVKSFPVAFDWVQSQSAQGDNTAVDVFGRRRKFEARESYKIRNFCIQSPASMVCLRKLVKLREGLPSGARLCFHVHDGYCLVCRRSEVESVCSVGTRILEEDDDLFPGLRLSVSCKFGDDLNNLESSRKVGII